jgi:riboflavin synthase
MFSGIIESTQIIKNTKSFNQVIQIEIERPSFFQDLKIGDSIAVNGVCLTLESFTSESLFFTLGFETLSLLKWKEEDLKNKSVNLERSLLFGDRIHGHLVSGHVDALAKILQREEQGDCLIFSFEIPRNLKPFIWAKGSVAVQGVSLTVNQVSEHAFSVCLIPETLRKTNLNQIQVNDWVNLEADYLIKGLSQSLKKEFGKELL